VDKWRHEIDSMLADEERVMNIHNAQGNRAKQIFNGAVALSLFLGFAGTLLAARLFTSGITTRIHVLEENAARLEQGLSLQPLGEANDEIATLGLAMERASHLLAARSERLKLALKAAKIAIWEMDVSSGEIRYEGAQEFIQSAEYPVGFLPRNRGALLEFIDSHGRAEAEQQFDETLACKIEMSGEYRIAANSDGTARWMSIAARHYPRGDTSGSFLGVLMDVTSRKRIEEITARQSRELAQSEATLREQRRILQCVVDSMGDGVIVASADGRFLLFNPAAEKIFGVGATEAPPDQWVKQYGVYLPDKVTPYPASELPLARALRGESVDREQLFVRKAKNQEGAWISSTSRPLKDETSAVWAGVVVIRDISERKRTEQAMRVAKDEAENANQAKSEFLSRMSHELRTPLNSIIGFAQILEMSEVSERTRVRLGHILKGGRHLLSLIEEVLDISRIEARRLSLSVEPVLVGDIIEQSIELVRPIAAQAGIKLEVGVSNASSQYVSADRQRSQQILLNLLSNAIKYNSASGLVTISCGAIGDKVRIYVKDTGMGIAEDQQPKLFQPFERLGAVQTGIEGTGLGLALSKALAEAMGGTIGVRSAVGEGATFWLELCVTEAPLRTLERATAPAAAEMKGPSSACTVLYIEDNLSNVRLMEDIFAIRPELKLVTAVQGQLGLDLAREHRPNLIFLDLHLPDLPGHQVLRRLRSDPRTRAIPVIVISADTTTGQVKRLLEAGAQDYLTKPIDVKKLLTVLDEHLSKTGEEWVLQS
jgi:PAS domain S-box-containing protein